jgi:hypothetical protein
MTPGARFEVRKEYYEKLPEIVEVYQRDGFGFGVVRVIVRGELAVFEFGLDAKGYSALVKVLQTRPYHLECRESYRYLVVGSVAHIMGSPPLQFQVRIQQGRDGRSFSFDGPESLIRNLVWFVELKELRDASHLRRVDLDGQTSTVPIKVVVPRLHRFLRGMFRRKN